MSKEKLKFKISGKTVVYEGHAEHRPKDLMDILAKLGVADDAAVSAFRENIDDEKSYSNDDIMELFKTSKKAREARDAKRSAAAVDSKPPKVPVPAQESETPAAAAPEEPQRITLTYRGKQFSYKGLPSGKQNAVLQLLSRQDDLTPEAAVETFRANLPESKATDAEIGELVDAQAKARQARKAQHSNPQEQGAVVASPSTDDWAASASHAAVDEYTNMSAEQRESLDNFIKQVLQKPVTDTDSLLRNEPPPVAASDDLPDGALTLRTSGKIPVYCQEEGTTGQKLVYATPTMTYADFATIVERKFGRKMALSFYEDEDVIELDDDDVLAMFLELSQQGDGKKLKLICSNPRNRRRPAEDMLTGGRDGSESQMGASVKTTRVKAYSNGELAVKEVRTFTGHTLAVYCCVISPKGDQFVTASRDRSVRLWNTKTGSCTVMKGGHNGFVLSCDFSPKGNRVVSSSDDRSIKIWNTTTFSKVATLKGHEDKVYCVQYNSTGEYIVSGSCDHTVRVWNAENCSKVASLKGHTLAVFSCCFSNSDRGKYVVSGSDDRLIKIWDWEAGKEVRSLLGHIGTVWSVRYSNSDAYIVSSSMDHELKLWNALTGVCVRTMAGHKAPIHHAIFSPNDKYIYSGARDWTVMVWRTEDGEHVETITGHMSTVYHIDVQNNTLLTSSLDDTIKMWEIEEVE